MSDSKVVDLFFRDLPVGDQKPKLHHDMERSVEILQGTFPTSMAGFVMVAVNDEGFWSVKHSCGDGSVLGRRMLAGLAAEAIREMLVTDACISDRLGSDA